MSTTVLVTTRLLNEQNRCSRPFCLTDILNFSVIKLCRTRIRSYTSNNNLFVYIYYSLFRRVVAYRFFTRAIWTNALVKVHRKTGRKQIFGNSTFTLKRLLLLDTRGQRYVIELRFILLISVDNWEWTGGLIQKRRELLFFLLVWYWRGVASLRCARARSVNQPISLSVIIILYNSN